MTHAGSSTNRRALPALCLVFAVIVAMCAIGLRLASSLDVANRSELQPIRGLVQNAPRVTVSGKAGRKLHIMILASDGAHHLTQDDLTADVPALMDLKSGDHVTAYVRHDSLGRNLDWLWVLKRGEVTLLSYEDTYNYLQRRNARIREIAWWAGTLSVGLFTVAAILRKRFGAWRVPCLG